VILPAREVAETIGPILDLLLPLREAGLVDELLVVDADSRDGTAGVAAGRGGGGGQRVGTGAGARPLPRQGRRDVAGGGEVESELLVFLDADTTGFSPDFLTGMLGPILLEPEVRLVKGSFHRPLAADGFLQDGEGGRVTELTARPPAQPPLPGPVRLRQPLAGEDRDRAGPLPPALGPGRLRGRDRDADRLPGARGP